MMPSGRGPPSTFNAQWDNPRKARTLRSIRLARVEPRIDILAHALNHETARKVEAAVIDALGLEHLSNEVRGWRSLEFGRIPLRELVAHYRAKPVTITQPAILIRINRRYRHGMSALELYESTRGVWVLDPTRARRALYAFAVYDRVVREVFEIRKWYPAGSTRYRTRTREEVEARRRWEFTGRLAANLIRRRYLDRSVERHFGRGQQNPIRYVRC